MSSKRCPDCSWAHPRLLESSRLTAVDNYCCASCGHVWTSDKETGAFLQHVTTPRQSTPKRTAS